MISKHFESPQHKITSCWVDGPRAPALLFLSHLFTFMSFLPYALVTFLNARLAQHSKVKLDCGSSAFGFLSLHVSL